MKQTHYTILSAICLVGAVVLAVLDKNAEQVVLLVGAGTTLAGRGKSGTHE